MKDILKDLNGANVLGIFMFVHISVFTYTLLADPKTHILLAYRPDPWAQCDRVEMPAEL